MTMKLPKEIYVTWRELESSDPFLSAETKLFDVADPDGGNVTIVGVYHLVEEKKLKRVVEVMPVAKRARGKRG